MKLVRVRTDDKLEDLVELNEEIFPGEPLEPIDIKRAVWWLVEDEGKYVGFCGVRVLTYNPWMAFLSRSGLLPSARGRGLQKRMIRTRLRYLKTAGVQTAVTYTAPDNLASANSLISCGFKLYEPESEWGGYDSLYFWKDIAG